jgi:ADP-ribose pyrophosphatase
MTTARALSRTDGTLVRRERIPERGVGRRPLKAFEVLVRVGLEVEAELRDALLDDPPHRFAKVGHEAHEAEGGDVGRPHSAEIGLEQRHVLVLPELMVDGEVGEVEEGIAHAGVLPVDDADARPVIDEVRVQKVVVGGLERRRTASALDLLGSLLRDVEAGREAHSVLLRGVPVDLDDAEGVEAAGDGRTLVDLAEDRRDSVDLWPGAHLLGRDRPTRDEARDEIALGLDEGDDLRPDSELGGGSGRRMLHVAVDAQELGVLAPDPQDKALGAEVDLEVVVRDPPAERLDPNVLTGPDTGCNLLGLHRAILRRVDIPLVEHPESVAIVAVEGDLLLCVRQARPGSGGMTLEIPSGKLEPGEAAAAAAVRELAEECEVQAAEWRELGGFWAAPAYSTELVHVFEARELTAAGGASPDPDEDVKVERVPLAVAMRKLSDAVSVAALALWLDER